VQYNEDAIEGGLVEEDEPPDFLIRMIGQHLRELQSRFSRQ